MSPFQEPGADEDDITEIIGLCKENGAPPPPVLPGGLEAGCVLTVLGALGQMCLGCR